tara:strand:- start:2059 stop:3240 length:1182 start_codon:yes stop_codon:yes gene_type:complete
MLNFKILGNKVQKYILTNIAAKIPELVLKGSPFDEIKNIDIIEQIESKSRCRSKLPSWYNTPGILYPNKLNIEQCSSEKTAYYKSTLVSGENLIDITAGFGVDSFYFSKKIKNILSCELDEKLSKTSEHNFKTLNTKNIRTKALNGLNFLKKKETIFDWIYIDPSRRGQNNEKKVFIKDCNPDISKHLNLFFKRSQNILIKLSPMVDIQALLKDVSNPKEIHIVAVKNEVKEILVVLKKGFSSETTIKAINLSSEQPNFEFKISNEKKVVLSYKSPEKYLYEPNLAVIKAGAFKILASKFKIGKLGPNTHLYTSSKIKNKFPGKIYNIKDVIPYNKRNLNKIIKGIKANIKSRNFPKSVNEIKEQYKLIDGGDIYLFFTSVDLNRVLLVCTKI